MSAPSRLIALAPDEAAMLAAINTRRIELGLGPVVFDQELAAVAQERSGDMARRNIFSHNTEDGGSYVDVLLQHGIDKGIVGEILGRTNVAEAADAIPLRCRDVRE